MRFLVLLFGTLVTATPGGLPGPEASPAAAVAHAAAQQQRPPQQAPPVSEAANELKPRATLLDFDYAAMKQAWKGFVIEKNGVVMPAAGRNSKTAVDGWDIGKGLADLLSRELAQAAPSVDVQRKVRAQRVEARPLADEKAVVPAAQAVEPADGAQPRFLVVGSVLRFGGESSGPGIPDAEGWSAAAQTFMSVLSMMRDRGHVALSVRIVDPSNGEIITSLKVEAQSQHRGPLLRGLKQKKDAPPVIDMASPEFQGTVLGEATMLAVKDVAQRVATSLQALSRQ